MPIGYETGIVLPPMHAGEVLRERFRVPLGLTAYIIARACGVPRTRIERCFGMGPQMWANLQTDYDLLTAQAAMGAAIDRIVPLERAAA